MKLEIQKDLNLSQMRFSLANNFMQDSRSEIRKKSSGSENKRKCSNRLKQIVSKQKVQEIKKQYISKLKLLVPHKNIPSQLLMLRKQPTNFLSLLLIKLEQTEGCKTGPTWNLVWKFIILIKVILVVFVSSFLLAFQQAKHEGIFMKVIQFSILFSMVDMVMNFTFQRFQSNKNLNYIKNISICYLKNDFCIDLLALLMSFALRINQNFIINTILLVLSLIKLLRSISKVEILQHIYITNVFHQRYYSIARVLMFNFIIGHFIAIITVLMSTLDAEQNWITTNNLSHAHWVQIYTWAYYWAVNIMLTVGFGDFTASNKYQASVLIFVETISCIMFAYNINTVGSILSDMKEKQRQRKNQLGILLKMSKENDVEKQTLQKAVNYVDESFNIKSKFFYEDHDCILSTLPDCIQSEYKKQSHGKMLLQLPLAHLFSRRSLMNVAEKICRKLAHPQQIIWKKSQPSRLLIVNKGKLGLALKYGNSKLNGQIIQNLQVDSNKSKLLTMNFFKNQRFQFDLKSISYCVIYHLSTQQLAEALNEKNIDYEFFCSIRDGAEFRLQSGELYQCKFCPKHKHDYFNCPKMHLVLMKRYVIFKDIFNKNKKRFKRTHICRGKSQNSYLKQWRRLKTLQQSFINQTEQNLKQEMKLEGQQIFKNPINLSSRELEIFSQKIAQSARSNIPLSSVFRDYDIQKLNTIFVAKMNEKQLCSGFWNIECDAAYNFQRYLKNSNSQNFKQFPLTFLSRMARSYTSTTPLSPFS